MIETLIVAGGGNAGLMAALMLKKSIKSLKVKIIASKKIGTIGVGEGSTEHWGLFTYACGITLNEIINECGATFKIGIKFENWHGDGTSYVHSIWGEMGKMDSVTGSPYTFLKHIVNGYKDLNWEIPFKGFLEEPLTNIFQFHFDSEKLNSFLQKKCSQAGIEIVDAEIYDIKLDNDGFIKSIITKDNREFTADFFIDSTGFKRVIASKLGADWIDWSKHLPLNSAIAFQTPEEDNIPTYTLAKAMTSGWSWKSPVQGRFGNGYVFSDSFISEEKALDEIQKNYQNPIHIGRKINFVSGKVNKAWIKNCICIGLSSNFVEPLEASSIASTVKQLQLAVGSLWNWSREDQYTIKVYNEHFDDIMSNILDFIQLHYFTKRQDSEFWKWCKNEITMTDFNKENLENFKKNFINQVILPEDGLTKNFRIYDCLNWIQIMHGLRMFDVPNLKKIYEKHFQELGNNDITDLNQMNSISTDNWITHKQAIEMIKSHNTDYKL